ncbi:MAG: hypothetical protein KGN76_15215 [Acidobacteriota bacterium]|nr:hypothetical protein [Acidobacteriota bacterium]
MTNEHASPHPSTSEPGRRTADEPITRAHDGEPASRQDEWGIYDPDRAGLRAILARIGAAAGADDDEAARRREAMLMRLSLDDDE